MPHTLFGRVGRQSKEKTTVYNDTRHSTMHATHSTCSSGTESQGCQGELSALVRMGLHRRVDAGLGRIDGGPGIKGVLIMDATHSTPPPALERNGWHVLATSTLPTSGLGNHMGKHTALAQWPRVYSRGNPSLFSCMFFYLRDLLSCSLHPSHVLWPGHWRAEHQCISPLEHPISWIMAVRAFTVCANPLVPSLSHTLAGAGGLRR